MSIDPDRYQVYAAIAGEGDWNLAVEALHRLTGDPRARATLAAKLLALRLGPGLDPAAMLQYGGAQAAQIERLLALADQGPPQDPGWPQLRIMARTNILMTAVSGDSQLPPAQALAELEELMTAAGGDDPMTANLVDAVHRMLSAAVSFEEGDASLPRRLADDAEVFRSVFHDHPEVQVMADGMSVIAEIQAIQQVGGDIRPEIVKLRQTVERLAPEHPIRETLEQWLATMGAASVIFDDVAGDAAQSGPDDFIAAEELAARTDADPDTRAMRHALAGGVALRGWEETDVDRVSVAVEHYRAAVDLTPAGGADRILHLSGFAMALSRRNELTNSMSDLDTAAEALTEARQLAGGPRHPQWSYINDMFTRIHTRRGGGTEHLSARHGPTGVAHRFPLRSSSARWSHERHASAMIVHVGFWHDAFTCELPSTTNRFFTSCDCWNWLSTDVLGSEPMRDVPSSWIDHPSVSSSRSTPITSIPAASNISLAVTAMSSAIFFSLSPNL